MFCLPWYSESAYELMVDRILASPHFGERMAMAWLDLARYGDTNGYVYGFEKCKDLLAEGQFETKQIWMGWTEEAFRCNASNNSGIQYRSKHITDDNVKNKWVVRGYQHELGNENKFPNTSGFIYDEGGKRGRICLVGEKANWTDGKKAVESTFLDEAGFQPKNS